MSICFRLLPLSLFFILGCDKQAPIEKKPAQAPAAPVQTAHIPGTSPQQGKALPVGHGAMPAGHGAMPHGQGAMPHGQGAMPHGQGHMAPGSGVVGGGTITGSLKLKEGLSAKPGSVIYVMARPVVPKGEPAPALAARRIELEGASFPIKFALGPADVMRGKPLSGELIVEARIDQDKDAMSRSPGDIMGRSQAIKVDGAAVELLLDTVL